MNKHFKGFLFIFFILISLLSKGQGTKIQDLPYYTGNSDSVLIPVAVLGGSVYTTYRVYGEDLGISAVFVRNDSLFEKKYGQDIFVSKLMGSSGIVNSVFGRTGDIIAQANDYTFAQIGSKPTTLLGYGIIDAYTKHDLQTDLQSQVSYLNLYHFPGDTSDYFEGGDGLAHDFWTKARSTPLTGVEQLIIDRRIKSDDNLMAGLGALQGQIDDLYSHGLGSDSLGMGFELIAHKTNDTLLGNSIILYPTQNAVKKYVDNKFGNKLNISDTGAMLQNYLTLIEGNSLYQPKGNYLNNITGYIIPGSNILINGSGTSVSPYVISSTFTDSGKYELLINKSSNVLLGTSNTLYPTQNAVKTYVDNGLALKLNISDTALMLNKYLRVNVAAATYQPIGNYLSNITGLINQGRFISISGNGTTGNPYTINYTGDTSNQNIDASLFERLVNKSVDTLMGNSDIRYPSQNAVRVFVNNAVRGKLNISDTASMLNNYLRSNIAAATYQIKGNYLTNITGYITNGANISISGNGTIGTPYLISANGTDSSLYELVSHKSTNTSLGTSDILYPTQNAVKTYVDNSLASKLNISDTALMLNKYLLTNVAASLYQPIGNYLTNITDLVVEGHDMTISGSGIHGDPYVFDYTGPEGSNGSDSFSTPHAITSLPAIGDNPGPNISAHDWILQEFYGSQSPISTITGGGTFELTSASTQNKTFGWSATRQIATAPLSTIIVASVNQSFTAPSPGNTVSGTQVVSVPTNTTTSYSIVVTASDGKVSTSTMQTNYLPKRYWGSNSTSTPTNTSIVNSTGGNSELSGSNSKLTPFSVNITGINQYVFYAYPLTEGPLSSIIVGGFESFGAFTRTTVNVTNSSGFIQDYYVYTSNNFFSNTTITFNSVQ